MRLVATYPLHSTTPALAMGADRIVSDLFETHADGIFRLAMLLLGRTADAEDVVQDTFLRLLRHVAAGGPLPNARGWLYTVAAHACRDRQRAGRRWLPWLAERDLRASRDRADARDAGEPILTALRHLPPRDRVLVALRAEGLSYAEIGTAARLRANSVGRILARALGRLEQELNALGVRP